MTSAPTFSVEFFPPKDEAGEKRLWDAIKSLNDVAPDFVSVTYGAGGSTRDRTIKITSQITSQTNIPTIAHLTCVGSSAIELENILQQYSAAGIRSILALRGDPQGGPTAEWTPTVGGFNHADELVSLGVEKGFEVGVAAFPDGHPASNGNFQQDVNVLLEKERRGATFATTQFFFEAQRYFDLISALRDAGSKLTVYPGVLPITNLSQLSRMAALSGTEVPNWISNQFAEAKDSLDEIRQIGVSIAVKLCNQLLSGGVPGLHFYTMNSAASTKEIIKKVGLR